MYNCDFILMFTSKSRKKKLTFYDNILFISSSGELSLWLQNDAAVFV